VEESPEHVMAQDITTAGVGPAARSGQSPISIELFFSSLPHDNFRLTQTDRAGAAANISSRKSTVVTWFAATHILSSPDW
jgi:hypothetical protein